MAQCSSLVPSGAPLWRRAAARGLIYGAAGESASLGPDAAYRRAFAGEAGMLVPENDMKWWSIRPTLEEFDFAGADYVAGLAAANGMLLRGHALVYHQDFAGGVEDAIRASSDPESLLVEHVGRVAGRYAGRMHSWDVVNEAIEISEGRPDGLRTGSVWFERLGPSYVETAFRAAAEADPGARLYYNDYGLELGEGSGAKREAVLGLVRDLKGRGAKVDGIGLQAHLEAEDFLSGFDEGGFRAFLREAASLGLRVLATELDVSDREGPPGADTRDRRTAEVYGRFLGALLDEPAVAGVLTWGICDRYSWLQVFNPRPDGRPQRPLPLSARLRRKPAWEAMAQAFDAAPERPPDAPPPPRD